MRNKLLKVAIFSSGFLPVPAVKGGAVESLCENFINENEKQKQIEIILFSNYDEAAVEKSKKYKFTKFKFIKIPKIILVFDKFIYKIFKSLFPNKNITSFRYIFQRLYFIIKIAKDISKNNYDKLLFENQITQLSSLRWFNNFKKYNGRYYLHVHNEITKKFGCKKYILSAHNITVSKFIADSLRKTLNDNNDIGDYSVLINSVDEKKFSNKISEKEKDELRRKYGIVLNNKVLLFMGRLNAEKGIDKLLLALKKVKFKNYKLLVVGSSFFGTDIKNSFAKSLMSIAEPIKDKIIFTGYIDYADVPSIYTIADIAVLPSICNDAAPLTIIEALTVGLPIITTKTGGIPEYVNDRCAIILEKDESLIDNLSKKIDLVINNQKMLTKMHRESLITAKNLTLNNYYFNFIDKLNIERSSDEL